jgi:O-antigen ligase
MTTTVSDFMNSTAAIPISTPTPDQDIDDINKDYECIFFGKKIINISTKTMLIFFLSLFVLTFCFAFIAIDRTTTNVFLPMISAIVFFWIPSPVQSNPTRQESIQKAQLLNSNYNLLSKITRNQA